MRAKVLACWIVGIALLVALRPLRQSIVDQRLYDGLQEPLPVEMVQKIQPEAVTGLVMGAVLGGFRGVAADILWMKMDEYWHNGFWDRMVPLLRTVTLLDPHFLTAWDTAGWHFLYNLTVEADNKDDPELKQYFIENGLAVYKEGIAWNPDKYDLYMQLGWSYFDKLDDYDNAAIWLRKAARIPGHPDYVERLLAHGFERKPDFDQALEWYDVSLRRDPAAKTYDGSTARGATISIRERYMPAWRLCKEGKYEEALKLVNEWLMYEPYGVIGLHFKAYIYEQMGDLHAALGTYEICSAHNALDSLAERRAVQLREQLGLPPAPKEWRRDLRRADEARDQQLMRDAKRQDLNPKGERPW
jgi:tetratricopeptide (TPR) repeat protein